MRAWTFFATALLVCFAARVPVRAGDEAFVIDPRALQAVERFEANWRAAKSATFRDVKSERLRGGKVIVEELAIKFMKPGRAYMRMIRPVAGREIIYDRTKNKNEMTVHPGHFPDLTLSINAYGSLATRDQHHTIESVGFDYAAYILRSGIQAAKRDPHGEKLSYLGEATFDGRKVDRVAMIGGNKQPGRVAARDDESLLAFARRVGMDAYVIFAANPNIRSLTSELDGGELIMVPPYYARRSESWFDRQTGMPLKQVMWDDRGQVYESYEHFDMVLNPPLTDADFDPKNPAYDF